MEEKQKKDGTRTYLTRFLRGMAEAQCADDQNFQKFHQFYSRSTNITDENVEIYLEEYLFKMLSIPSNESERRDSLLNCSETLSFGNDTNFIKKVISRLTHNSEEIREKTLAYIARKFQKMRITSKFVEYLMRSVETNQVLFDMGPLLQDCLAESFLKMPLSQSLAMGTSMCDKIYSEHEQLKTDDIGKL